MAEVVRIRAGDRLGALLAPGGELADAAAKKQEGASSEGAIFQRIEKNLHGHRGAVSDVRKILKWSKDKQADYIRTLEPLLVHYGLTLDAIDPEDLVAQAAKQAEGEPTPGSNGGTNPLDKARANLAGGAADDDAARARATEANGSVQLRKFVGALRAGRTLEEATVIGELEAEEARLTFESEGRGEFADMEVIEPPRKKGGRPKLGIVANGETVQ